MTVAAQTPVATHVEVKVINVDVTVTDSAGRPATDLTQDDFEILEDNQPQKITNFYVVENARKRSAETVRSDDVDLRQFRRKLILLVDNNYIDKRDRDAALNKLAEFVDQAFTGDSEWCLGSIGQQLEIVQPFTSDKTIVHAAIAKIRRGGTTSFRSDMDRDILSDPFRRYEKGAGYDYDETVRFHGRERTYRNVRSLANTARGLIDAARAYSATEGKKLIVLVTGGMELNTSFSAYDRGSDREMQDIKKLSEKLIEEMVREANTTNVSIHVINVRPREMAAPQHDVQHSGSGARIRATGSDPIDTSDIDSSSYTLATSTGGSYQTSNLVKQSFEAVDLKAANFYSLGYTPPHADDRRYHSITVRVKKSGLHVAHRRGYVDLSPEERLEQFLRLRTSVLQPAEAVPVTLDVGPASSVDGKPVLPVTAVMPLSKVTLLPAEGRFKGRVHVYLSIFNKDGQNVGFHHQMQDLALSPDQQASGDAFRYRMNVRLDKGEFTVAVTLRDDLSREIGTAVKKLRL